VYFRRTVETDVCGCELPSTGLGCDFVRGMMNIWYWYWYIC